MLDLDTRTAVLKLAREGHGIRAIARALAIARNSVREVLRDGHVEVPRVERDERLADHLERVRELHTLCQGNLVRIAEELAQQGVPVGYSTLTAFCRRHGIGVTPKRRAGRYDFPPGDEMQHDTSPHRVAVAGRRRALHCASLVLAYSRMIFAQVYPRWSRFEAKVFFTEALRFFDGAAARCVVDNSSVVIFHGTGKNAVVAPEIEAFARRFGFRFEAHAVGDADRSGKVERPFHYIEHNFYPGRVFPTLPDLNRQLRAWCETVNGRPKRHLGLPPRELFAAEKPALRPLPIFVPEVYALHVRRVDVEGYVSVHANRYSVPTALIGRQVEVRESAELIRIFDGARPVAEHPRQEPNLHLRFVLPEHHEPRRHRCAPAPPSPEETTLRAAAPALATLVDRLRNRDGGAAVRSMRQLHRLFLDYPTDALVAAVTTALEYGLTDLGRIERMTLRQLAGDFFRLPPGDPDPDPGGDPTDG